MGPPFSQSGSEAVNRGVVILDYVRRSTQDSLFSITVQATMGPTKGYRELM